MVHLHHHLLGTFVHLDIHNFSECLNCLLYAPPRRLRLAPRWTLWLLLYQPLAAVLARPPRAHLPLRRRPRQLRSPYLDQRLLPRALLLWTLRLLRRGHLPRSLRLIRLRHRPLLDRRPRRTSAAGLCRPHSLRGGELPALPPLLRPLHQPLLLTPPALPHSLTLPMLPSVAPPSSPRCAWSSPASSP